MAELDEWIEQCKGVVSIDADFFTLAEERQLATQVRNWVARAVADGVRVVVRDDHVDLVELVEHPVDFIINFDYHMDCRIEYLHGAPPMIPPQNPTVFETLLSDGLAQRYIWVLPASRAREAGLVYSSAFAANRQPILTRIHCLGGPYVFDRILGRVQVDLLFICRSPEYATPETDAIFDDLVSLVPTPHG